MVLEGPNIKDQMADTTPAAFAIAQMLKCNCISQAQPGSVIFFSTLVPGSGRFQLTNVLGYS